MTDMENAPASPSGPRKPTLLEGLTAFCVTVILLVTGAIFVQMLGQAGTLGSQGTKLDQLDTRITSLQTSQNEGFQEVKESISQLRAGLDLSRTDLRTMISNLGVVEPGAQFEAVIYDGAVWAFPTQASTSAEFERAGLEREQVNQSLYGFRVYELDPDAIGAIPQQ